MGNSIYLGGGIKSAFCGGNVKEIWQGSNKIFGGGGGEPMPEGYEQVDYLEVLSGYSGNEKISYGVQFYNDIQSTDVLKIELDFKTTEGIGNENFQVGKAGNVAIFLKKYNGYLMVGKPTAYNTGGSITLTKTAYDGSLAHIEISKNSSNILTAKATLSNGTILEGSGGMYYGFSARDFICLFNTIPSSCAGSKIHYLKIWDETETTQKHNIIAAKRKSDNAPAMVDTITQQIFDCSATAFLPVKE